MSFLAGSDVPQTITSRHQPEFACTVGGFTRVWEGFSWVMVPGVGVVLNTGQLTSWAGGYCWFE